jgi:uncharacterized membrane protein
MLTDFPIALWSTSLLGDIAAAWLGQMAYRELAFWALALGLIIAVPTIVAGLIDFAAIPQGHPATTAATWHMWSMLSAATAYGGSLIAHLGRFYLSRSAIWTSIGLSALGLVLLTVGGWFGGELVFRHGIGSEREFEDKRP